MARAKIWKFRIRESGPFHGVEMETPDLTPTEAGQALKDSLSQMRVIMGHFKKYPRVLEPTWLSDSVKTRLTKLED